MKCLSIAVMVLFIFSAGFAAPCIAVEESNPGDVSADMSTETVEEKAPLADDAEFGENNRREMPQYENYDENTGMPNVVGSDKTGEL